MNLDYPRDVHDPFAEADPVKLADYRAWAHRALDALLDARLAWETERRAHATQSPLVATKLPLYPAGTAPAICTLLQ